MNDREQKEKHEITLPVDWHFSEHIRSQYANNMLIQAGRFEFTISFFEMQLPILSGTPEDNRAKLEEMGEIRAECVSKIVLPPELVPELINALQTELEKYKSQNQ